MVCNKDTGCAINCWAIAHDTPSSSNSSTCRHTDRHMLFIAHVCY